MMDLSFQRILNLAWPATVAAMVHPLLGLIDAAILGYSPRPYDVGAVGMASSIIALLYFTFGFLRMATSGMTAQAVGAEDEQRIRQILLQSISLALAIGVVLIMLQAPMKWVFFNFMTSNAIIEADTIIAAKAYFSIRIWASPFAMVAFCIFGWLTARGYTGRMMVMSFALAAINLVFNMIFVLGFQMGAVGVAWGTFIAECAGVIIGLGFIAHILHENGGLRIFWDKIKIWDHHLKAFFNLNRDILIRSIILNCCFFVFVKSGTAFGDDVLSANQVLLSFFMLTGMALDGPAIAAETLAGQIIGKHDKSLMQARFKALTRKVIIISLVLSSSFVLIYILFKSAILAAAAPDPGIHAAASTVYIWVLFSPWIITPAFVLEGFYFAATRGRAIRNSMIFAGIAFALAIWVSVPIWGVHGIWGSLAVMMLIRGGSFVVYWRGFDVFWATAKQP